MSVTFRGYWMAEIVVPSGVTASVTTEAGGPTSVAITAGTYATLLDLLDQLNTDFDNGQPPTGGSGWDFDYSNNGFDGVVGVQAGSDDFSITWTSTALRDLLGFTGNLSSVASADATQAPRGVWHPDCPLFVDGDYKSAPMLTDLRQAVTPTGTVYGNVGNVRYRHTGLRYSHVPTDRVWIAQETVTNASLERFAKDTQWGQGHAWFTPSSRIKIYAHTGSLVGTSASVTQWAIIGAASMDDLVKRVDEWDGRWAVNVASIVARSQ